MLVFSGTWKLFKCIIDEEAVEQVKHYKNLGIHFQYNTIWTTHCKSAINKANIRAMARS